MSDRFSDQQIRKAFDFIDTDHSGFIDKNEVASLLKYMGFKGKKLEDTLEVGSSHLYSGPLRPGRHKTQQTELSRYTAQQVDYGVWYDCVSVCVCVRACVCVCVVRMERRGLTGSILL